MILTIEIDILANLGSPLDDAVDLVDDPISQISLDSLPSGRVRQKQPTRSKAIIAFELRKKQGFGFGIDISDYRMPRSPNTISQSQRRNQQTPSYSDGFEGLELQPTGRTMPVRRSHNWQDRIPKITLSFGQLTLVGNKQFENNDDQNCGVQVRVTLLRASKLSCFSTSSITCLTSSLLWAHCLTPHETIGLIPKLHLLENIDSMTDAAYNTS